MQIVGYDSGVGHLRFDPIEGVSGMPEPAALVLADGSDVWRVLLESGRELAFRLADRHCAGSHDGEVHDPCERTDVPRCDAHTSSWACARCTGQCDKPLDACEEEHAVYIAAFAPNTFKVGVTRCWRLHARLREQGADRGAHLRTVSDGRIARRIERELATDVPDRVGISTKAAGLHRTVSDPAWSRILDAHDPIDVFDFEYGFDLDERPILETLASGTVLGTQGRLLVLEHASSTYAVDLRGLVGYEVELGGTDRELQSSLGAFG